MTRPTEPKRSRFSPLFYNAVSYSGALLAFFVFFVEVFLFALDFFVHRGNVYLGLITYVILPPFLIFGLLLIPAGALWKKRRVRQGKAPLHPEPLHIDPANPHHRNALFVFIIGTSVLVIMSFVGAYKAFHYSESVEFCGIVCHQVMKPEHTAYLNSPHAKVKCVECHIGEGAGWYVRSKLSGARQIYHAVKGDYSRPIETPVANLRPAEDTCKQCHWPGKHFGTFDFSRKYFLMEEGAESPWHIRMLVNVGAGDGQSYGVHAHMNVDHDIYYAAEDERRQNITWVKAVDKSGREEIYVAPGSKFKDAPPPAEAIRKMDCIDCHNRPTHQFQAPYRLMNDALQKGKIDASIPDIKAKGMAVLAKDYETEKEALAAIPAAFEKYYQENHAEYYEANKETVDKAAAEVAGLFSKNVFPEMKTRWDSNPDNIGHLITPGCFRCHDGEHRAASGKTITKDCNACHKIVEQGPAAAIEKNIDGLPFRHPVDIDDQWQETSCSDCHTGS